MAWPPTDPLGRILMDLAGAKVIEYHGTERTDSGRLHRITTAHGYEIALADEEVLPFAVGAGAADFNRTHAYTLAAELVDEAVYQRWQSGPEQD